MNGATSYIANGSSAWTKSPACTSASASLPTMEPGNSDALFPAL